MGITALPFGHRVARLMAAVSELDTRLDAAIASGDDHRICTVYGDIANWHREQGNTDGACFFWTQALVYAMVDGDDRAESGLRDLLAQHGRV